MFDHTPPRQPYRSRPHTCSVTGSLLLAAGVPAVLWAISNPVVTALVVVAVIVVVRAVRALGARVAARSAASPPAVAAGQ
jgi:hypothetical protein